MSRIVLASPQCSTTPLHMPEPLLLPSRQSKSQAEQHEMCCSIEGLHCLQTSVWLAQVLQRHANKQVSKTSILRAVAYIQDSSKSDATQEADMHL